MAQLSPALEEVSNCERRHAPVRQAHPGPGTGSGCVWCAVPGRLLHVAGLLDAAAGLARRPALRVDAVPSRLGSRGRCGGRHHAGLPWRLRAVHGLSLIHISEPTRLGMISYAVFCLKKKNNKTLEV